MTDQRDDLIRRAATPADVDVLTTMLDAATRAHRGEPTTADQVVH
jgi:hypothetical protein